jgi:hypothetical protein
LLQVATCSSFGLLFRLWCLPRNASARPSRNYLRVFFFILYYKRNIRDIFQSTGKNFDIETAADKPANSHPPTHSNKGGKFDIVVHFVVVSSWFSLFSWKWNCRCLLLGARESLLWLSFRSIQKNELGKRVRRPARAG